MDGFVVEDQVFGEDTGEVVGPVFDETGEVVVGEVVVHVGEVHVVENGIEEEEEVEEMEEVAVVELAVGEVEFEEMYQRGILKDP